MRFFVPLAVLLAVAAPPRAQTTFFVAPDGSDAHPGTREKPFATVERALAAARAHPGVDTIVLRGGTYFLAKPLALTSADSHLTVRAASGETPVLSGGVRLTGWRQSAPGRWETTLPAPWRFDQLFVDGQRRYRPRLPKQDYYRIAGAAPATPENAALGFDRFRFAPGQIRADWRRPSEIEALVFHNWEMSRLPLKSIDEGERTVTLAGRTIGKEAYTDLSRGRRYLLENVKEALSEPGEWYLDRQTGVVTYLARPGEDPNRQTVIAPKTERLMTIEGAAHLRFEGIVFAHDNWTCPPAGHSTWQAETDIPAALDIRASQDIRFERCTVRNIGTYALSFSEGCQGCAVRRCRLIDLGAGGVRIGESDVRPEEKQTRQVEVSQCLVAQGGRMHPAAVGVWIGQAHHCTVAGCEIVDFYYTAVSVGWTWGYGPSGAHHNRIADNRLHRIGQGVLSDMGGIYTLGIQPGTELKGNVLHDIAAETYGGWGIYFDEGSTGIVAEGNTVYRTKSAPFHQHYGKGNVVRNNILALGTEAQLMRSRAEEHNSFTAERNIIYWREGPLLGSNWAGTPGKNFTVRGNLYWNAAGAKFDLPPGEDSGLVADPLFVAPEKGDFRLKPGSPAARIGFQPVAESAPRFRIPPASPAFPTPRPAPPAPPIAETFEEDPVGAPPGHPLGSVAVESDIPDASIAVTEETAARGKRSLKLVDASGQKYRYNPHLYYRPSVADGVVEGRFALRWEAGAVFYHEWRDASSPYKAGPSLTVDAGGVLRAAGEERMTLPAGRWMDVTIRCTLGSGVWSLAVKLPGRTPPMRWSDLPCGSGKAFSALRWWGFVMDGDGPGTVYLDDLFLAPS